MTQKYNKQHLFLTAALLISICITACQTTSSARTKKVVKVLNAQDAVVDALIKERESQNMQEALGGNDQLVRAEAHLKAALESLKSSNQKIKESLKYDAH